MNIIISDLMSVLKDEDNIRKIFLPLTTLEEKIYEKFK